MDPAKLAARNYKRFWAKVDKTGECWLWTAGTFTSGYGQFWMYGEGITAQRAAVLLEGQTIPEGWQVDHLCRTRLCVRLDHLEVVTAWENNRRSTSPSAKNLVKTHCPQGHPYDETNTYHLKKKVGRMCRQCLRDAWNRRYAAGKYHYRRGKKAA